METHNAKRIRRCKAICIPLYEGRFKLMIDEDDYLILREIHVKSQMEICNPDKEIFHMIQKKENNRENKISDLRIGLFNDNLRFLPSIGQLTTLVRLDLSYSTIQSLPLSIERLQNLKELILDYTTFSKLPEEIGDLDTLERLSLFSSKITKLPPSIGRLRNLKKLDLSSTKLMTLPEEVGDLISLDTLELQNSEITVLPPSIGRLRNLKELDLRSTKLITLPKEVGDLASLATLDFRKSEITVLPPSIGRLQNLKTLCLTQALNLSKLAEGIGNLQSLKLLVITGSKPEIGGRTAYELLLMIAIRCRSLTVIRFESGRIGRKEEEKINYRLMCNQARNRIWSGNTDENIVQTRPKIWPRLLNSPRRLFHNDHCSFENLYLAKPDVIYHLLTEARESFVVFLLNRGTKDDSAKKNVS